MKKSYNENYNVEQSESLFEILKKSIKILSKKKQKVFISSLLFCYEKEPFIDFLSLIYLIIDNIDNLDLLKEIIENVNDYKYLLRKLLFSNGAFNIMHYLKSDGAK